MPKYMQEARQVTVTSPLGDNTLLFKRLSAEERLGRLFEYELTVTSEESQVNFDDIVGQNITIELERPDGDTRYFNGFVSRFVQVSGDADLSEYRATLVPWLWFLTRTADCRIFQQKTVPDIIKEVFSDNGFTDFENALSGNYREWVYCVQYRETDFDFVSRLMEQEGIYYYFEHSDGKHVLVLADDASAHQAYSGYEEILYRPEGTDEDMEHITGWTLEQQVQPGNFVHTDYDFEKSRTHLQSKKSVWRNHRASDGEIFDYPGEFIETGDGENYATIRIQELQVAHEVVSSRTDACGVCSGYTFKLVDHPREDQCREYLVTSTSIQIEAEEYRSAGTDSDAGQTMKCRFSAIDATTPYRSARTTPRPIIQGPQTGVVVGMSGEEIWTDKYGRVKVQFHWDRYGKSDENSSCWIRVSHDWAGKQWGAIYLPRMGQEVIVEFLEGDPDRPIITGRVYNSNCMPPYPLPDMKTRSGVKTRSTTNGTAENFNEIRFEDKLGEEELYLHAEKDENIVVENDKSEDVGHDETLSVGNDRTRKVARDESAKIERDQMVTVDHDRTIIVGEDATLEVGNQIRLVVGKSSIQMTKEGLIIIDGTELYINGKSIDIRAEQTFSYAANEVSVTATSSHQLKGATIRHNC